MWVDIDYEIERLENLKTNVASQYQKEINIVAQKITIASNLKYSRKDVKSLGRMYKNLVDEAHQVLEEIERDLQVILRAKEVFQKYMLTGV